MRYEFIWKHQEYPVAKWVKMLQVSRSGYYKYVERRESRKKEQKRKDKIIKNIFDESGGTYGPGRICGVMRRQGEKASYGKVSDSMARQGLSSIHNLHKTRSLTDSRKARGKGYPNLVKGKKFTERYQAVCSDITYLRSGEGWLYLCVVKDIVTGEVLGEATGERMKKELVIQAFLNAQARHSFPEGVIFHWNL